MPDPILLALFATLGVFVLFLLVTMFVLVLVGLPAIRTVSRSSRETNEALRELTEKSEQLNESLAELAERQAEVEQHLGRLGVSLERLSVLTWAISDARSSLADVRALIPRK